MGQFCFRAETIGVTEADAHVALTLARSLGSPVLECRALVAIGAVLKRRYRIEDGRRVLEAAVALATTTVEREPLVRSYRGQSLHVLPELNGGPTMLLAFEHLAKHGGKPGTAPDGARFVAYANALEFAWDDRFRRMGDAGERGLPTSTTHLTAIDADGKTGELLYTDNFKDFQSMEGENADPLRGMFENLLALEDRIAGVFTQKEVEATRTLFTR